MFPGNLPFPPYIAVWFCFSQDLFGRLRDPLPGNLKTQTLDREQELRQRPFMALEFRWWAQILFHGRIKWKWLSKTHFPLREGPMQVRLNQRREDGVYLGTSRSTCHSACLLEMFETACQNSI